MTNYTKESVKESILTEAEKCGVEYVKLQFTGLLGEFKSVEIPVGKLECALENDIMLDGSSIAGFAQIQNSDMYLYPDLNTWQILPTNIEHGDVVARLICDIHLPDGSPFLGDPRNILKKVLKEAEEMGFTSFNAGPEPEFFLFKVNEDDENVLETADKGRYFDMAPLDKSEVVRRDISSTLKNSGFVPEALHHEVALGQSEVGFKFSEALRTADNVQTFKTIVKKVAANHCLQASFMPKPIFGENGSGMHCNVSLFKGNQNVFFDTNDKNQLSETAYQFIAGVLKHARANAAITNPIVNSYKRLVPGYEAPCYVAWSTSNRSCMIRIPAARGLATRVEVRNPDPSANPYLALAVILKAGLEGIKNGYELPSEKKTNLYEMNDEERISLGIDTLPANLKEAIDCMKEDKLLAYVLGEHAFSNYIELKEEEWDEYRLQVSQWEKDRYLNL